MQTGTQLLGSDGSALYGSSEQGQHWQKLQHILEKSGPQRLLKRQKEAQRFLKEIHETHDLFSVTGSVNEQRFDPVPMILGSQEWEELAAGLTQRAELLNLILTDLYGEQRVLKNQLLPAELVYHHPAFLYPSARLRPDSMKYLDIYSAVVAKGKDHTFRVTEDRTQPSFGAGFALANRIVMRNSYPKLFTKFQVHMLATYFRTLRRHLASLAVRNIQEPLVVILSSGPGDLSYFEHAYLASYLGFPLVQGGDLVVHDGSVWLKSVEGLQRVDVILNRLPEDLCDPLELRGDSQHGVPGLLESIRIGNVQSANFLGSRVLENSGMMAFLPGLCRYFLGEELRLPSVATWWCGQEQEKRYVLENMDSLVVRPIFASSGSRIWIPGLHSESDKEAMKHSILEKPYFFVGQEITDFQKVPSFGESGLESRIASLHTFVTANDLSYTVMPGGFTHVHDGLEILLPWHGKGTIKDTFVLTSEPEKQVNLWLKPKENQRIEPTFKALPSRAAENLFWAGRYVERLEGTSRLMHSVLIKLRAFQELRDPDDRLLLNHLLPALTEVTLSLPGFIGEGSEKRLEDPRKELLQLASNPAKAGSLRSLLEYLAGATYAVREMIPEQAWRIVDHLNKTWEPKVAIANIGRGRLYDSIDQLLLHLSAFSGLISENMSRESAWLMLNIGRRIERSLNLIVLLQATMEPFRSSHLESHMMEAVLKTCNSLNVFRRRYRSFMQPSTILDLLLADANYPRALAYQLRQIQDHIRALPVNPFRSRPFPEETIMETVSSRLIHVDSRDLIREVAGDRSYPYLDSFLSDMKEKLETLSDVLTRVYFTPTLNPQRYGGALEEAES